MTKTIWNANNNVIPAINDWDRLFNNVFGNYSTQSNDWKPSVDIHEDEKAFTINMDLPGMTKKDISINIREQVLSISGKRESKSDNLYRQERNFGSFSRSFNLPDEVNVEKIDAKFKEGVLTINLPLVTPIKPKEIEVKIN